MVAADHPLAAGAGPLGREALEPYVQLVLTDRTDAHAQHCSGGVVASRIWRFADLSTRLEFLLAGFGWCNMPLHMVEDHIRRRPAEAARRSPAARRSNCRSTSSTSAAGGSAAPAAG